MRAPKALFAELPGFSPKLAGRLVSPDYPQGILKRSLLNFG
jgi:hypothetical protein